MANYRIHRTDDGETFRRVTTFSGDEWNAVEKFFEIVRASNDLDSDFRLQRIYPKQSPDTIRWAKPRDYKNADDIQNLDQE